MADPAAPLGPELEMNHNEHLVETVEHPIEEHHAEISALGLAPAGWVGLAMLVFLGILVWKKVPAVITGGLDSKIAEIRRQLDEAKALRAEAEALRKEYADKIAGAEKDAAGMLDHARLEADAIIAKAEVDTENVIARRKQMAEDKIGAAQRGVVDALRAQAASAATSAARDLIAQEHGSAADKALVDKAIAGI